MVKNVAHILYHTSVVLLSAALALSVPSALSIMARSLLNAWAFIENEKFFLITLEMATAVLLIIFFNGLRRGWEDRRIARMAKSAGLVMASPARGIFSRRKINKMKKELGFARELMIIGSTGCRSFVDSEGDMYEALRNCREAKIMLLNPFAEGAVNRARSIPDAEITPEVIREQIIKSIGFLKGLREAQKLVRLKLYPDQPLLKMTIVGDYVFLRHYHTGQNVRQMPEYAFKNEQQHGGLYVPLYRYFLARWQDPDIPEYDLDTDELVYRDRSENEIRRVRFDGTVSSPDATQEQDNHYSETGDDDSRPSSSSFPPSLSLSL